MRCRKQFQVHSSHERMYTYCLQCGDFGQIWYVGRTVDIDRRLREHWKGEGAEWTKLHAPRKLYAVYNGDVENDLTMEMMLKHGWENVRGGFWCMRSMGKPKALDRYKPHIMTAQTQQISECRIDEWQIGPSVKNTKGGLSWPITLNKGVKVHPRFQCGGDNIQLRVPFGLSTFGDQVSDRQSLDYSISPWYDQIREFLVNLDNHIVEHVWQNREEFFPKKQFANKAELESLYCPVFNNKNTDYDPIFKTKVNIHSVKIFEVNEQGAKKGDYTAITPGCHMVPICQVSRIWVMSGKFGLTIDTQAAMVWPKTQQQMEDLFTTSFMSM